MNDKSVKIEKTENGKRKKRIIIWGMGDYGQNMGNAILQQKDSEFELKGFADSYIERFEGQAAKDIFKYDSLRKNYNKVLSLYEVKTMFDEDEIDSVVIAIADMDARQSVLFILSGWGITVYDMTHRIDQIREKFLLDDMLAPKGLCGLEGGTLFVQGTEYAPKVWILDSDGEYVEFVDNMGYRPINKDSINLYISEETDEICVIDMSATMNYWHALYDLLSRIHTIERYGYKGKYLVYRCNNTENVLRLYGLNNERIIWIEPNGQTRVFKCGRIYFFGGAPYSTYTEPLIEAGDLMLRNANAKVLNRQIKPYKKVYIKRIGSRQWMYAENILEDYGFTAVIPERLSIEEQIVVFSNAEVLITAHGANSANCLFMREGSAFIEAFPEDWINPCCCDVCEKKGIRYQMITENTFKKITSKKGFFINPVLVRLALRNAGCSVENRE